METKRGILFLALCKADYVHLARNCAASLRNCGYTGPICLITDDATFNRARFDVSDSRYFDFFNSVKIHNELSKDRAEIGRTKLLLYDLSPFDETLFIDADMICPAAFNVEKAFADLSGREFHSRIDGKHAPFSPKDAVAEIIGCRKEHLYYTHTAVIWFKKGPVAESVFRDALSIWEKLTALGPTTFPITFYGGISDEICFAGGLAFKYEFDSFDYKGLCAFNHTWNAVDEYNSRDVICTWGSGQYFMGMQLLNSYRLFFAEVCKSLAKKGVACQHFYNITEKLQME